MCYFIGMFFYLLFYLFALMMGYLLFSIYDFILFLLFLGAYRYLIRFLKKHYFIADAIASTLIVIVIYLPNYDLSLCSYFFLMHFIVLESFTYTYLDVTKYDNSLTKS